MPLYRALTCLAVCCALVTAAHAQTPQPKSDPHLKLRVDALLEEARLLIQEFESLDPVTRAVREEDERLRSEERQLARESGEMHRAVAQHNRAANELSEQLREHRQRCPKTMNDDAAIDACNARGAELVARGQALDASRAQIAERQQEMNRRITLFNASQQSWVKVRREHLPKLSVNEADANQWVARAMAFSKTNDFAALVADAGAPEPCMALRGWVPPAKPGIPGLKKLYACLALVAPQ